jgi:spore coat polysaccharide biosynthesis protein SpsF (cytidylyltransferase family)
MSIGTVVSARMGSTRLPGKAMLDFGGCPLIEHLFRRIEGTKLGGNIYFATTERSEDTQMADLIAQLGIEVFRGANEDVAGRYLALAQLKGIAWIVRITGDCPFVDAESLDYCLSQCDFLHSDIVYTTKGKFPIGIDYEVFSTDLLASEWLAMTPEEKEHVTLRFYGTQSRAQIRQFTTPDSWIETKQTFTIDTESDYRTGLRRLKLLEERFSIQDLLRL